MQARSQPPQWAGSSWVWTQAEPHAVCPAGQTHTPPAQVWPGAQARPQAPQCCASVIRVRQVPPQLVCPPVQAHTPPD